MKKILHISLLFSLMAGLVAAAPRNTVTISDLNVTKNGDKVYVDFTAQVGAAATSSDYNLTVIPILTDKQTRRELRPIVIQGPRAKIAYERNFSETGVDPFKDAVFASNDQVVNYSASVPFESWMSGSDLALDGVSEGCCASERKPLDVIAKNLLPQTAETQTPPTEMVASVPAVVPAPVPAPTPTPVPAPVTTGEALAKQYPFMQPMDKFYSGEWFDKNNAIVVYFRVNHTNIEPDFRSNYQTLVDLISVVKAMEKSGDAHVSRVVIAGFASPEGSFSHNMYLASTRANVLREFIRINTHIDMSDIQIYNGGEDWDGLRKMVAASNMFDKQQVLRIIDAPQVYDDHHPGGRLAQLKMLDEGRTYRYMFDNFFPDLRNATYIRVFYENNK